MGILCSKIFQSKEESEEEMGEKSEEEYMQIEEEEEEEYIQIEEEEMEDQNILIEREIIELDILCKNKKIPYNFMNRIMANSLNPIYIACKSGDGQSKKAPLFAIKVLPYNTAKDIESVKALLEILSIFDGDPNFIQLESSFTMPYFGQESFFFVMKYYQYSDLFDYGYRDNKLKELEISYIMLQILNILQALKIKKIVHNDIKLENFLIDSILPVKIHLTDFDFAEKIVDYSTQKVGTPCYMAPEVFFESQHDYAADIWALGICAFVLFCHRFPFKFDENDLNNVDMIQKCLLNNELERPDEIPGSAWKIIYEMLQKDPSDRITVEEALEFDWFKENDYMQLADKKFVSVCKSSIDYAFKHMNNDFY